MTGGYHRLQETAIPEYDQILQDLSTMMAEDPSIAEVKLIEKYGKVKVEEAYFYDELSNTVEKD